MNEQLQTALAEMLGKANSGIDAGASFLQAQLPDVIQQLLVWNFTKSLIIGAACSVAAIIGLILAVRLGTKYAKQSRKRGLAWDKYNHMSASDVEMDVRRAAREEYQQTPDGDPADLVVAIAGGVAGAVLVAPAAMQSLKAFQIWLAPKIYLIEYAASLAK